jgi:cytochrome c peroxidase
MDQIVAVFENPKEFDAGMHEFSEDILKDSLYTELFERVYGSISPGKRNMVKALSVYVATLNGFNSRFDKIIRGEDNTFSSKEKLGFNIFMGKARCATCHFIPLTNGTVPPLYKESEREVLGVPATSENLYLDKDYGIFWLNRMEFQKGMFKTPTIRNSDLTAPKLGVVWVLVLIFIIKHFLRALLV